MVIKRLDQNIDLAAEEIAEALLPLKDISVKHYEKIITQTTEKVMEHLKQKGFPEEKIVDMILTINGIILDKLKSLLSQKPA